MNRSGIKRILLIILVTGLVLGGYYLYNNYLDIAKEEKEDALIDSPYKYLEEPDYIVVEIRGEVKSPGVYKFYKDEVIINDCIEMANGLTRRAKTDNLNLTDIVYNHSIIYIGSIDSLSYVLEEGEEIELININTATKEELMKLPGIGEAIAEQILTYRKDHGYFRSKEDIKNVSRIGETLYSKIKDYITV